MKKIIFAVLIICALSLPAFAAEEVQTAIYQHPTLSEQQEKNPELPQPYDAICQQLSNGKDDVLATLREETAPYVTHSEFEILERIGSVAATLLQEIRYLELQNSALTVWTVWKHSRRRQEWQQPL